MQLCWLLLLLQIEIFLTKLAGILVVCLIFLVCMNTSKTYKLTPERSKIILDAIASGMTQRDAAKLSGVSEDTLCNWKRNNSDFSEQMERKSIEYKQSLVQIINKAAITNWKAAVWILQHRWKREFSDDRMTDKEMVKDFPDYDFNMQAITDRVLERI